MGARVLVHLSELGEGCTRLPFAIGRQNGMLVAVARGHGGRGMVGGRTSDTRTRQSLLAEVFLPQALRQADLGSSSMPCRLTSVKLGFPSSKVVALLPNPLGGHKG